MDHLTNALCPPFQIPVVSESSLKDILRHQRRYDSKLRVQLLKGYEDVRIFYDLEHTTDLVNNIIDAKVHCGSMLLHMLQ